MKRPFLAMLLGVCMGFLLLAACGTPPTLTALAVLPTDTSVPTVTTTPTRTPTATSTRTPTPTATFTSSPTTMAMPTPEPTSTALPEGPLKEQPSIPYPDPSLLQIGLARFAAIGVSHEAQVRGMAYETRQNKVNPDAAPIAFAREPDSKTVILAYSPGRGWHIAMLRDLGDAAGILIGTTGDISDSDWDGELTNQTPYELLPNSSYLPVQGTILDNFSLLWPDGVFMQYRLAEYPTRPPAYFTQLARKGDMVLKILSFYRRDIPDELEQASPSEVEAAMRKRVDYVLDHAEKGQVTQVMFEDEVFVPGGYLDSTIYYKTFGRDYLSVAYLMFYRTAQQRGLTVGKDIILTYCDDAIELPNTKSEFVFAELKRVKAEIAKGLGLPVEQVQLDVVFQFHMHAGAKDNRGWDSLSVKDLESKAGEIEANIERFGEAIGAVHIGEVDVAGTDDLGIKKQAITKVLEICLQSSYCKEFTLWTPFYFAQENPRIFDQGYSPTEVYWAIYRMLEAHLSEGTP